ncbi:hypothetical protein [Microbacterium sp. 22242]|uniref:hypothetical protein n=1 Tax=Microbacterium sp. 22242 TaxID=3453896 RepID=UPI003F837564
MNHYIVLYHAPRSVAERFARATPEEAQAGLGAWQEWAERLGPALVYPGSPLAQALTVTAGGAVDADTDVIGMSILQAATRDAALDLVRAHHHLTWDEGCCIALLEEAQIPELARP